MPSNHEQGLIPGEVAGPTAPSVSGKSVSDQIAQMTSEEEVAEDTVELSTEETTTESVTEQEATNVEGEQEERPEWLDPKFKSPQDMAKAYAELQKKLGTPKGEQDSTQEAVVKPSDLKVGTPPPIPGVDYNKLTEEFESTGQLSAESYKNLTDKGIPKEMVDAYIGNAVAVREKTATELMAGVGGKEKFNQMAEWARTNMSKEDLAAFDGAVMRDKASAKLALSSLKANFEAANGKEPKLVGGGSPKGSATFKSVDQIERAMKDPRYGKDDVYTNEIADKIIRSNVY